MDDHEIRQVPAVVDAIRRDTRQLGFTMASEPQTGSLLRTLAASKPSGRFLELGTGTGVGTAWLLAGMDASFDGSYGFYTRHILVGDSALVSSFRVNNQVDPPTAGLVIVEVP